MNEISVKQLLDIYRLRLKMAECGTTHPKASVVAGVRKLVAGLEAMAPDAKVEGDALPGKYTFRDARTGAMIAEIEFDNEAEPTAAASPPLGR
jgi:hypothetical protein